MIKNTIAINLCPLCSCKKSSKVISNNKNLYSSLFSQALNIDENILLKYFKNVKCKNCGLIYKNKWINSKVKNFIYSKKIKFHPTGQDVLKGNFSYMSFTRKFKKAYYNYSINNIENLEKYKREILSLLNSIDEKSSKFKQKKNLYFKMIRHNDFKNLIKLNTYLKSKFKYKKKYTRYTGYGNDEIWRHINQNLPNIKKYAEVGCPGWGMYKEAKKSKKDIYFITNENKNFWDCGYRKSKINKMENCLLLSKNKFNFKLIDLKNLKDDFFSYVGLYNYIDHLEKPNLFFNKIFKKTNSIGIIIKLLKNSKTDIQHCTTWTRKSIIFLCKKFNYKMIKKTFKLSNTGYDFFLLRRDG